MIDSLDYLEDGWSNKKKKVNLVLKNILVAVQNHA